MNAITNEDSMSDDVFEDQEITEARAVSNNIKRQTDELHIRNPDDENYFRTPSPTGYPGYKPPREALKLYALQSEYFIENKMYDNLGDEEEGDGHKETRRVENFDDDDGWKAYKNAIGEDNIGCDGDCNGAEKFDDSIIHKVSYFPLKKKTQKYLPLTLFYINSF